MIVIICVKLLTNMTDKAGGNAEKKVEVTASLTAPATPPTEACLTIRIKEDRPTLADLPQSCAVLRTERRGCVKDHHGAHQAATHAVAVDGRRQPGLLIHLNGPGIIK